MIQILQEAVEVNFRQGNASAMPFADNTFDLIFCRAAFKNFSQPVEAMNEMYRVLKPGARALIIDLRKDASMESLSLDDRQGPFQRVINTTVGQFDCVREPSSPDGTGRRHIE